MRWAAEFLRSSGADPRSSALAGGVDWHRPIRNDDLPDLPVVQKTISDLAAAFTDPEYGVVTDSNCSVLVDEGDLRLLGRRIRSAVSQAKDLLLVYFVGHGLIGGKRHELYLALPDSELEAPEFNSLEFDKIRSAVLDSQARTKIVILDCCFSGRAITGGMADSVTAVTGQIEVDGTYVLTSAQRDQVALVLPGEEHTAFTGRLLRLLREGVAGGPELLTIDDIYRNLLLSMKAEGLSEPQKLGMRNADLLSLARNRAFAATAGPLLEHRRAAAVELGEKGDWAAARDLLRSVLGEQVRIFGEDHDDALRTRQVLAHSIGGAGDPAEAAQLLRDLLVEQTRRQGGDRAETLQTRQFLAVNLGEAGYRDEAIAILRVLLPDRRRLLGQEEPHTLRTCHMLARNLALTGSTNEAVALLRELLAVRERILGSDHPHTQRVQRDLTALVAANRGDSDV